MTGVHGIDQPVGATGSQQPAAHVPLSLLVIDDDQTVLQAIRLCLRTTGWTVNAIHDLKDGLKLDPAALPDVILCDVGIPNLNGVQVIASLKSDPQTKDIPVVLMTGIAGANMFSHVPWTCFLEKPFNSRELIGTIKEAAAHRAVPRP